MLKIIFKIIVKFISWLLGILVLGLALLFLWHRFQLGQEAKLIGQQVQVDGQKMNVYTTGKGKKTLVFLSGLGTSSPVLDFKALYSRLEDDYRIVVVERLGYGFSDDSGDSRSLDKVLSQTRQALKAAKVSGPYVLVPHSLSGYEAVYWANQHPEEVTGIVSLEMTVPTSADVASNSNSDLKKMKQQNQMIRLVVETGLIRLPFIYNIDAEPPFRAGALTDKEKAILKALMYRNLTSKAIRNEVKAMPENSQIVSALPVPQVPTLYFIAQDKNIKDQNALKTLNERNQKYQEMADQNPQAKLITLEGSHYIHDDQAEEIAKQMKEFLTLFKNEN